ncbi:uncharacterized protein LOC119659723 isoform X2 [Hermetia illucens]|uniref:uncharacterized protein LOC119659723 isoform X2 n=1 Tax=Hermetia illucens TaxID=343691 RepID=UPI0018CC18CF|nr:uncharacterized protein LOC119659723 isoform X2 [Hermetia illucens]
MLQCKCEVCLKRSIKTEKIQLKAFDRKEPGILSKSKVQLKEDECEPPAAISKEQRELPPLVSQPTQTVQLPVKQKPTILPSRREPDIDVSVPTIGQAISVELKPNNARDLSPSLPSRHFANPVVLKTTRGEKARTSPCRVLQQSNESRKVSSDRELPSVQYPIRIHQTPKKDKKAEISTPLQSAPLQFGETCRCEQCESSNLRQTSPIKVKSQVGEHIFQKPRIPSPTFTDYTGKVEQPLGVTGDVHECTCEICQEGGTKECPSKYKRFTCFHCCKRKQKSVISCHRRPSKTKLERMSDPIDSIKPSSSSKIDKVETTSLHTIFPPVSPKASTRSIHSSMITSCPCLYSLESSEKDESQVCTCKSELSLIGKISEETEKPEETLGSQIPSRSVARISQGSLLSCVTSCSCWRVQDDETFSSKSTSEIESFISVKSSREFEEVTEGERIPCTCKTKPPPATQEVIPIESEEQLHEESESISVEPAFSRLTTSQLSAAKSMRSLFGTSSAQISIPINDRHPEESISSNLGKSYEDISLPEKSCSCTVCQLTPGQPLIHENLEQDYHDSPGSKSETCRTTTIDIPNRKSKTQFTYKCPQYRNHGDDVECQERRRRDIIDQRTKRCAICRRLLMDSDGCQVQTCSCSARGVPCPLDSTLHKTESFFYRAARLLLESDSELHGVSETAKTLFRFIFSELKNIKRILHQRITGESTSRSREDDCCQISACYCSAIGTPPGIRRSFNFPELKPFESAPSLLRSPLFDSDEHIPLSRSMFSHSFCYCGLTVQIVSIKAVGKKALMVTWKYDGNKDISRFEIYVDGYLKCHKFSPCRNIAIVNDVDINKEHHIRIIAIPKTSPLIRNGMALRGLYLPEEYRGTYSRTCLYQPQGPA